MAGTTFSVCAVLVPFLWRTAVPFNIVASLFCLFGVPVTWAFGGILRYAQRSISFFDFVAVSAGLLLSVFLCIFLEEGTARRWIFEFNYPTHRAYVKELLDELPMEDTSNERSMTEQELESSAAHRARLHSASVQYPDGKLRLILRTVCGPSLERIVFSPHPVAELEPFSLVKHDELGFWYCVSR